MEAKPKGTRDYWAYFRRTRRAMHAAALFSTLSTSATQSPSARQQQQQYDTYGTIDITPPRGHNFPVIATLVFCFPLTLPTTCHFFYLFLNAHARLVRPTYIPKGVDWHPEQTG